MEKEDYIKEVAYPRKKWKSTLLLRFLSRNADIGSHGPSLFSNNLRGELFRYWERRGVQTDSSCQTCSDTTLPPLPREYNSMPLLSGGG